MKHAAVNTLVATEPLSPLLFVSICRVLCFRFLSCMFVLVISFVGYFKGYVTCYIFLCIFYLPILLLRLAFSAVFFKLSLSECLSCRGVRSNLVFSYFSISFSLSVLVFRLFLFFRLVCLCCLLFLQIACLKRVFWNWAFLFYRRFDTAKACMCIILIESQDNLY